MKMVNTRKTSRILALVLGGGMLLSAASAEAAFRWPWEKRQEDKRPAPTAPVPRRDLPGKNPGGNTNPLPNAGNPLPKTQAQHEDAPILQKLHEMNLEQVEMAEVALLRAANPKVKQFAQSLLNDHREADRVIRERAKTLSVTLREERKAVTLIEARKQVGRMPGQTVADAVERSKGADELADLSGAEFDTTYLARSMELYDLVRAEFAAFKASESGAFHDQLAAQFDKLVKYRDQAKQLHDTIRNDNRETLKDRQDVKGTDSVKK